MIQKSISPEEYFTKLQEEEHNLNLLLSKNKRRQEEYQLKIFEIKHNLRVGDDITWELRGKTMRGVITKIQMFRSLCELRAMYVLLYNENGNLGKRELKLRSIEGVEKYSNDISLLNTATPFSGDITKWDKINPQ
jgi:hypothetical protein